MDFGLELNSQILFVPRGHRFVGTGPSGKQNGLQWKSKYAVVGANALDTIGFVDGLNEKGLAGGLFYLPGTVYQDVKQKEAHNSIAGYELLTWILTNFSTIDQIKKALPTIYVSNAPYLGWDSVEPVHVIVHDAAGKSLVIEYIDGKLKTYNNPHGTITNQPPFNMHQKNLQHYADAIQINTDIPVKRLAHKLGLPSDSSSKSRFIHAAVVSQNVPPQTTEKAAIKMASRILRLFENWITQWTSVCDTKNKRYYLFMGDNKRVIDLNMLKHENAVLKLWVDEE